MIGKYRWMTLKELARHCLANQDDREAAHELAYRVAEYTHGKNWMGRD